MKKPVLRSLTIAVLAMAAVSAQADIINAGYGAELNSAAIYGTNNSNTGFTVSKSNGLGTIEVGLRAHLRYPQPHDTLPTDLGNDGSNNIYTQPAGGFGSGGILALWNWDWSINIDSNNLKASAPSTNLSNYTYKMGVDYSSALGDATATTYTFDPVNGAGLGSTCNDNSFGNNVTLQSSGAEANCSSANLSAKSDYKTLVQTSNLVQNSWNMGSFFSSAPGLFHPNADGQYTIFLEVYANGVNSDSSALARSQIEVMVAGAPTSVPEPGSLALVGLGLAGLAAARRRTQKQ